jgi:TrmH family RNA methyltransferase
LVRQKTVRESERTFVVEGVLNVMAALEGTTVVEAVFVAPGAPSDVLDAARQRDVAVYLLDAGVIERVADTVTPQPVMATVPFVDRPIEDLADATFVLVGASVRDPGNAGTILRSAEAAGADGVLFPDGSVDVFNPKTVRASAGSIFHVPVVSGGDAARAVGQLRAAGMTAVAAVAHGGVDPGTADFRRRVALVFGNEASGLDDALDAAVDERVTVPVHGRAESLNVSMAAAVLAFEVARQRRS